MGDIRLEGVSKFYGEVMGVNRVSVVFEPGITGVVGPNGAGKSTLMSLIAGLVRPSRGTISVPGASVDDPARFYRTVGYCTQYDAFPAGMSGRQFMRATLRLYGHTARQAAERAAAALERVGLRAAADRRIDVYSKGMRQALKLAHAVCHDPQVLLLDEPLNGLDPQARAEAQALFREFAARGAHVLVSSHILHEVDAVSDRVVFLDGGTVVSDGVAAGEATAKSPRPTRVSIRCDRAAYVAARLVRLGRGVRSALARRRRRADRKHPRHRCVLPGLERTGLPGRRAHRGGRADGGVRRRHLPGSDCGTQLMLRLLAAVVAVEFARIVRPRGSVPAYALAVLPIALAFAVGVVGGGARLLGVLYNLLIGATVFFGCAFVFTKLFRGEILERTLHYYFLAPLRREVLLLGKYVAGVAAAWALFGTSTVLSYVLLFGLGDGSVAARWIPALLSDFSTTLLACVGYGSVFLLFGLTFRNPILPVARAPRLGKPALSAAAVAADGQRPALPGRVDVDAVACAGQPHRQPGDAAVAVGRRGFDHRLGGFGACARRLAAAPAGDPLYGRLSRFRSARGTCALTFGQWTRTLFAMPGRSVRAPRRIVDRR